MESQQPFPSALPEPRHYQEGEAFDYPTGEGLRERERPPFRFWVPSSPLIVLGRSQQPNLEVRLGEAARDGIGLYQRIGGGGTVVLTSDCLCVALRFRRRKDFSIPDYFRLGSALVKEAVFRKTGLRLEDEGLSDLALGGRKLAGCSCYLPRDYALYLSSVLIGDCRREVERYLAHPSREPDYRQGRPHGEFMSCLGDFMPRATGPGEFIPSCMEALEGITQHLDWP